MRRLPHVDRDTVLAILGLVVLAVGLALIYLPAAFVVVGSLVIIYAILPDQTPGGPAQ